MTKTTFLGYVPSLKSKHEATIVNGRAMKSKGGSIRYLLEGEYDGRKTLPKTVSKEDFVKVYGFDAKEAESVIVGSPSPASVEPPAPSEKPFPQEPSNENFSAETEVKEALGLFGKKEEEKEEPKTQEFTVVLQEGDKLELTDIEEEDEAPEDEKTEKEAETLEITDIDWETDDEDVDLPASVLVPSSVVEDEIADYLSDEYGFLVRGYVLNAETYEAVQAKVTRPVKEEEKEESDEGLSTGAKVALGVGALAAGVALFGAEEDDWEMIECGNCDETFAIDEGLDIGGIDYCEECYDTIMSKENVEDYIPYESETDYSRIYEASVNVGEKRVMSRKDYDIDNELSGFSNMDYTLDLDDHEDEITDSVEDTIIDAIRESVDENLPIEDGDSGSGSVNVDTEIEISVPISGDIDYEWDATINHEDDEHDEDWNAEHESESDGYTYAYTKGHKDGMDNEVIYRPSIETDREKTIFKKILKQKADTVGNPSPSGPSSTPEPAEATGSEPSNENMEAEGSNMKMAMGVLALGVGAVALLGGDRIKKIFDRFNL